MSVVTRNLRIFIMERKPKDIGEKSILAEQFWKYMEIPIISPMWIINTDRIW